MILTDEDIARFWSKVAVRGEDECWEWLAGIRNGYGQFWLGGKMLYAHRVSFFLAHGRWPKNFALHTCDNAMCVNAAHIYDGDHTQNMEDMVRRGRQAKGESHTSSKLTEADVREIHELRAQRWTQQKIADRFGVSNQQVSRILNGERWKHI